MRDKVPGPYSRQRQGEGKGVHSTVHNQLEEVAQCSRVSCSHTHPYPAYVSIGAQTLPA